MKDLSNKSVLFFSPQFFNYEIEIKRTFEELGANVTWFDDRPSNNFMSKVLIRLNRNSISGRIENYYKNILQELKEKRLKFDYVFFLNPEAITNNSLKQLKTEFHDAEFIIYMWDSFKNRKSSIELLQFFDRKFTFDSSDAQFYHLQLRPLFYIDLYASKQIDEFLYNLLFVGTLHTDRYIYVNKVISQLSKKSKIKLYFFLSSKILFWVRKILDNDFRKVKYNEVSFTSISHTENSQLVHQSEIILDVNHTKQIGLTMRTFEALGAQRKLITTNPDVVNYDFYNENNILIIDRQNPILSEDFLKKPFIKYDEEILNKYSVKGWISELFN